MLMDDDLIIQILLKLIFALIVILMIQSRVAFLHMPRQLSCRGMCINVTQSDHYFSCKSNTYFDKI